MERIGVDIEEISEIEKYAKNKKFLDQIFSKRELEYCNSKTNPAESLAGKFCTKEAIIKALDKKILMAKIEVINSSSGKPKIFIKGKFMKNILCSISHTKKYAISFVLIK